MSMEFIASYWLACLPVANYYLLLYSAGRDGETRRRSPKTVAKRKFHLLVVNPFAKNALSIAQNCSETQISFCRRATLSLKTCCRSPKTVAKRKFHFARGNPLVKNVVSIAQNCSETQISFCSRQPSRLKRAVDRSKL